MNEQEITKRLYSQISAREWKRLVKDEAHRLELDTSLHFLQKYLPKHGLILDAGGGPGRYTIELAKRGYDVVLLDLTPANLELAKKKIRQYGVRDKVRAIQEGSITDLSMFDNNSFDSVICLGGPLSHVAPESQRRKSVSELIRVAKANAPIFVSVMAKFGIMMNALKRWPKEVKMTKHWNELANEGEDYMWHGGDGYCHYFTLTELEGLFNSKTRIIERVGLEGLASVITEDVNKQFKDGLIKKNWLNTHYKLCTHPSVVDTSLHMMLVCRKK